MNQTMLDFLREKAQQICVKGTKLLGEHSRTHYVDCIISPYGNYYWDDLPPAGKQIQAMLLPIIDRFAELVRALIKDLPSQSQRKIEAALVRIKHAVEQNVSTCWKTKEECVAGFEALLSEVTSALEGYYGSNSNGVLAVPDTNALIANPDIEQWRCNELDAFTLVLTPTVLAELDEHKINHRNENVRDKANKLIRMMKEYRRRGSLLEGVTIVRDRISLRSVAVEPNIAGSLPWFDPGNADDRFLASALEIIRQNCGSVVFVVTSDINMQNKAEFAGIPYREVPHRIVKEA